MKRKVLLLSAVALAIVSLVAAISLLASPDKWTYLGSEDYRVVAMVDGIPVVFNALQDRDKEKIKEAVSGTFTENGVEVFDQSPDVEKKWDGERPDVVPPLKFKQITLQNTLADLPKAVFEVSYEEEGKVKKVKIVKLDLNGKTVLAPADPEYSTRGLIPSPDHTKYLLATEKGLWLIETGKENAVKISKDEFNGKTYAELNTELQKRLAGQEGPAILWWNDNPIFSPDGSKIVYMTNRDCVATGGSSLWLHDLATGEERPLIKNVGGEHYRCTAWLDNKRIVYQKFTGSTGSLYFITDVEGVSKELKLEGKNPSILAVHDGTLAWTPDCSAPKEIYLAKVDLDGTVVKLYEKSVNGTLRQVISDVIPVNYNNFSPDGSRFAYLFAPDTDDTVQNIAIVNLKTKEEVILKEAPSKEGARTVFYDFTWLDDRRLLVRVTRVVNGINNISSWIYAERGVVR